MRSVDISILELRCALFLSVLDASAVAVFIFAFPRRGG
jgi:hypothetical protein